MTTQAILITDTCSAIKLLGMGARFFEPGVVPEGDLILHPRVHRETRAWTKEKKIKYKKELETLKTVRNTSVSLSLSREEFEKQRKIVQVTRKYYDLSVGEADIEQLVAAIYHEHDIVTDDGHFGELAELMAVKTYDAEDIVLSALKNRSITRKDATALKNKWTQNREKMSGKL